MYYILEGHTPKKVDNVLEWVKAFEKQERIVKQDVLPTGEFVSTVFMGDGFVSIFTGEPPLLFETVILGGEHDGYQKRYATWDEAEAGHKKAVELIFEV